MSNFYTLSAYFKHQLRAKTRHGTHSPFVYKLLDEVFYLKGSYYDYEKINLIRSKMELDTRVLNIVDLGAGSKKLGNQRSVMDIAKTSVKKKKLAELLYRIVLNQKPKTTIEFGTSLGITTCYLALANPKSQVYTIEGDMSIRSVAMENFKALDLKNIRSILGNFDEILPELLNQLEEVNFAFIDGNHRKDATLRYFKQLLPKMSNGSFIIFDDIYWSREMTEAWNEIIQSNQLTVTIDLFYFGIAFIRQEQVKEHFTIRF